MSQISDSVYEIYKEMKELNDNGCDDHEALQVIKLAILNNIMKDTDSIAKSLGAISWKDRKNVEEWE